MTATPFYHFVPKDVAANLRWRVRMRQAALHDVDVQQALKQAAFSDVLFFFNAFCWVHEPRSKQTTKPMVTWPHQDRLILALDNSIDVAVDREEPLDVVVDKSRDQGATYSYLYVILRRWLRDRGFYGGLMTRNEDLVDSARNMNALMLKLDWQIRLLPFWMLPAGFDYDGYRLLSEHTMFNPETEAIIAGNSATGDVSRGGRATVFALDELGALEFIKAGTDHKALASTARVANCRWLVSTQGADYGAFYDACSKPGHGVKVIMDWRDNPTQNKDLYRLRQGRIWPVSGVPFDPETIAMLEKEHQMLRARGYVLDDDRTRNHWYNLECLRPDSNPRMIARELDRDPRGAVSKVFQDAILKQMLAECCRPPDRRGRFVFDSETAEPVEPFVVDAQFGELSLWCSVDLSGRPPVGRFIIACDISGGSGGAYTSNSVAHVLNRMTGEQVAEWVSNTTRPEKFAYVVVALCRWFHGAKLIWEANFLGAFAKVVLDVLKYDNIYERKTVLEGLGKDTSKPGFWMTDDNVKLHLFEMMQAAWASGGVIPRSEAMVTECGEYEWQKGKIVHLGATKEEDGSAQGKAHADRAIAGSLAVHELGETPKISQETEDSAIPDHLLPRGSFAELVRTYEQRREAFDGPGSWEGLDIRG